MSANNHESDQVVEVEDFEITDEKIQEFVEQGPSYHSILQIWREVLEPSGKAAVEKPTPAYCNRIITSYPEVRYADMVRFRDLFYSRIDELKAILATEIESDDNCLKHLTAEEDAEFNGQHYKNLLRDWQLAILEWEKDWHCEDTDAAISLATISEIHKMFFGQTGLTSMLDNIPFEYTDADREELGQALEAAKDAE